MLIDLGDGEWHDLEALSESQARLAISLATDELRIPVNSCHAHHLRDQIEELREWIEYLRTSTEEAFPVAA